MHVMTSKFELLKTIAISCGKTYSKEIAKAITDGEKITAGDIVIFLGMFTDGILRGFAQETKVDYKNLCTDYINFLQKTLEQIGERKTVNQEVEGVDGNP